MSSKISEILCRAGSAEDVEGLVRLHRRYLYLGPLDGDIQSGFVRFEYTEEDFTHMVRHSEIAVASCEDEVIGYYLVGHSIETSAFNAQKRMVRSLGHSLFDVAVGAQAVVDERYRGLGVLHRMLRTLEPMLRDRYEYLFSQVSKVNAQALSAHLRTGYRIVGETDDRYYVIYTVKR